MKTNNRKSSRKVTQQRLLVPVDFSDASLHAFRYAVALAKNLKACLFALHVVPADYGWLGIGKEEARDLDKSLQRQASDRLSAFVESNSRAKLPTELEVRIGQPTKEIVAAAQETNSDLIVLSTHGLTGLDRYLIGSVTDRLARIAPCPVLLVPPEKRWTNRHSTRSRTMRFKHLRKRDLV